MDLPRFDPSKLVARSAAPGDGPSVIDTIKTSIRRDAAMGDPLGVRRMFGLPRTPPPVQRLDGTTVPYNERALLTRARQVAFDPTQIMGITRAR